MISSAIAQSLTPVTAPASGMPWWVGFVVAAVILVAGFIWLKIKKPTVAAKVETDAEALGKVIGAATQAAIAHIQAHPAAPATPEVATPAVDSLQPQLDAANGKLAQIKAILDA